MEQVQGRKAEKEFTLVTRKPYFDLSTACPLCLPVFIYLKLAHFPFRLAFNSIYPDSVMYELWVGSDGRSAYGIYYSDLSWPIGKVLFLKQVYIVKQRLGKIYRRAKIAYGALSARLGEHNFLFDDGPSSLDATFLGLALVTLHAFPETSVLRSKLLEHDNIVRYAKKLKRELIDSGSSSSAPQFHSVPSSSAPRKGPSKWSSKPNREKTTEEKTFKRAKYFLAGQLLAVLLFLSLMGGYNSGNLKPDDNAEGYTLD